MVNVVQSVLALLSLSPFRSLPGDSLQSTQARSTNKSIAIVGAGSAGLGVLKAILDLPLETRQFWSIVVFEQCRDVGGIWLPDPIPPHPPVLPSTPLYPRLHTNTPHPTMTFPGFPFRPMTPLYPSHEYVLEYHRDYAEKFGLRHYIRFNTTVLAASWQEQRSNGIWNVQTQYQLEGNIQDGVETHQFDHLIVASGHNRYPAVPDFPGSSKWLNNTPPGSANRTILHSIFYRNPEDYVNRTVVIVGGGASGVDITLQLVPFSRKVYLSLKEIPTNFSFSPDVILKPRISYFTRDGPVFIDNTSVVDADAVILATGYELRIPFLDAGGALRTDPHATSNNSNEGYTGLTTNLHYLFPLHEMIFSLSSQYTSTALSFVGLPDMVSNCPSDRAQGLFVAHAIANNSLLPPREELLAQLARYEAGQVVASLNVFPFIQAVSTDLKSQGFDPYYIGHRLVGDGVPEDYQDRIVQFLKDNGAIPLDGNKYVDQWRRDVLHDASLLNRAWTRVESLGREVERSWLHGVTTERDWVDLLYRLMRWQQQYEKGRGEAFHAMYNNTRLLL